jgi:DNA-binding GntR family transcriptional regulator
MARPERTSIRLPAVKKSASLPYLAIRDYIAARIASGQFAAGSQLPSERQLHEALRKNRGTIRDALLQLEGEGLIFRQSRSGWYVGGGRVRYDPSSPEGFMSYVAHQGRTPATQTLAAREVKLDVAVAAHLGVPAGTAGYELLRLRSIDQRPVLVEHLYVSSRLFPGLLQHSTDGSLSGLLKEHYGTQVVGMSISMSPCLLPQAEANLLRGVSGTPGLRLTRRSFDGDKNVVEYNIEYWRHDVIDVHMEVAFGTSAAGGSALQPSRSTRRRPRP